MLSHTQPSADTEQQRLLPSQPETSRISSVLASSFHQRTRTCASSRRGFEAIGTATTGQSPGRLGIQTCGAR